MTWLSVQMALIWHGGQVGRAADLIVVAGLLAAPLVIMLLPGLADPRRKQPPARPTPAPATRPVQPPEVAARPVRDDWCGLDGCVCCALHVPLPHVPAD